MKKMIDYKQHNCDMLIYEKGVCGDLGMDYLRRSREVIRLDYYDDGAVYFTVRVGGNKKNFSIPVKQILSLMKEDKALAKKAAEILLEVE